MKYSDGFCMIEYNFITKLFDLLNLL